MPRLSHVDDASVTVTWRRQERPDGELFAFVPVRIRAAGGFDIVTAPGERTPVPPGRIVLEVEVPGHAPLIYTIAVERGERHEAVLSPEMLVPEPGAAGRQEAPRGLAVEVVPWSRPVVPPPIRRDDVVLRPVEGGVTIARQAGIALSAGIELVTRVTPRRLLAVPPVSAGDAYRLVWHRPQALDRRPRIEPTDPGGRLLMDYLLTGRYRLAAVAARYVDRARGDADPLKWVVPSYTQLLIGYSYALGRDRRRLSAWCERTAASTELGPDGLVLAAEAAWQRDRPQEARDLLIRATELPTVTVGGELGVRLATLIAARSAEPDPALLAIGNRWLPVLTCADGNAANLSVAETHTMSPDIEGAPRLDQLRWIVHYALSRWRYARLRARVIEFALTEEKPMKSVRHGVLLLVVGLTLAVGLSLLFERITAGSNAWLAIGALQALVFLAIGASAGSYHYQRLLAETSNRADEAEARAREYHDAAIKGRALAAVLYADAQDSETSVRHARIAHEIFHPRRVKVSQPPELAE
ncbi:hypothetical protein GCM10027452_01330 [Micromonospora halotolerans]